MVMYLCVRGIRRVSGHVYVLGVSMSVQRQDNDRSCICVRCIDVCAKTGQ